MTLFQNSNPIKSQSYAEWQTYPMYVHYSDYSGTDTFAMQVVYDWWGSTKEDFTVKVYSKQDLTIRDPDGNTNQIHMDGN